MLILLPVTQVTHWYGNCCTKEVKDFVMFLLLREFVSVSVLGDNSRV